VDIGHFSGEFASPAQAADAAALAAGAIAIGPAWTAIDQPQARVMIRRLLASDLAYKAPCMPDAQAMGFADEVMSLVPAPTHFFTSIGMDERFGLRDGVAVKSHTFTPVTMATFSAAVAVVGKDRTAVLVVSDED